MRSISVNADLTRIEFARQLGVEPRSCAEVRATPAIINESDPTRFMAAFAAAAGAGGDVFLVDPALRAAQRAELAGLVQPGCETGRTVGDGRGWLMIPTGGTGGRMKFARHDEQTIGAAVRGFAAHFDLPRVDAIGVLPLHHVSGLMAWMRCALTGGRYVAWEWKKIEAGDFPPAGSVGPAPVISLVPTQVQRLMGVPKAVEWLRRFRVILLGGGPAWPGLVAALAEAKLPSSLSYGMTETAAMITALRPEEFLAGARTCGGALPHGRVRTNAEGVVVAGGDSIFRGYYPEWREEREFTTADLGQIDERGHLRILGRRDAVIITGGKKIHAEEVEAALRASGQFPDVAVVGVPDAEWGEAVVACFPKTMRTPDVAQAVAGLMSFQRPKQFIAVADWPRNAQGKVNRAALVALARAAAPPAGAPP